MTAGATIHQRLNILRRALARHVLWRGWLRALMLALSLAFLLVLLEGWRYFPVLVRRQLVNFYLLFVMILLGIPVLLYYLICRHQLQTYDDLHLARHIGAAKPEIKDALVNALQLELLVQQQTPGFSAQLVGRTLEKVAAQLAGCDLKSLVPTAELKQIGRRVLLLLAALTLVWMLFPTHFGPAWMRLSHPTREFTVPLPFTIQSVTDKREVLGGDSLTLRFKCVGDFPDQLRLQLNFPDYTQQQTLSIDTTGRAVYTIPAVRHDLIYEAYVENRSPFRAWRRVTSGLDTIRVINRPEILRVRLQIDFPAYTHLPPQRQESNNPEILLYKGSTVGIEVMTNKPIRRGLLKFGHAPEIGLACQGTHATGRFRVTEEDEFYLNVWDEQEVANRDPLLYRLRLQNDAYPTVTLLTPKGDFNLTEEMTIPLGVRISDDFGFSRALISYRLIKHYTDNPPAEQEAPFPLRELTNPLQELFYLWKIADLNLAPEDAVEFQLVIYDNDLVSGPKKGVSNTIRARFPSLNELFTAANETQEELFEEGSAIAEQLQQTRQVLEQVARELLKKPNVSWEQQKQLESEMRKTEQAAEKLNKLGQKIEELVQSARQNQLWTPETLAKYAQLQQAFQEIMTPELREALRQLQQALEKMDPQQVKQALDNFKLNQQQFSQELERLLQLFQRIRIEQAVDELTRRFADLAQRQQALDSTLKRTAPADQKRLEQLASEQEALRKESEVARDILERTVKQLEEFPNLPRQELAEVGQALDDKAIIGNQREAQQALRKGNQAAAAVKTRQAAHDLRQLADQMQRYRQEFAKRSLAEVLGDFQRILNRTLQLSQMQEKLQKQIAQTPRQSDQVMDVAVKQSELYQSLGNILNDLMQLSNKTFGVTPRIGKGMGEAAGNMRRTIENLEEREVNAATRQAGKTTQALNRTAFEVLAAMQQLQQSGSASGFENYLEQLRQISGAQQGLNAETQLLSLGEGGEQLGLQRLAARQQQIKQSLEQLQQEMSGQTKQTGDLGGIVQDMEEVIKDLQNNQLLRRTIERQQRILSRLLDAQQSLRTQDYKEERVSKTGEELVRQSPTDLPTNLGARRNRLQENLERALRDGYRREYQEVIRRYFENLRQEAQE